MRKSLSFFLLSAFVFVYSQAILNPGDHIISGKIILVNDKTIPFYDLKCGDDDKVNYTNAESTQPEFLYLSSIKSIDTENVLTQAEIDELERLREERNPTITYTTFDNKGEEVKLQNPRPGKAMVYFVRTDNYGYLYNFRFFDNDRFIGKFAGSGYIGYECDPGEHLFWVSCANAQFIEANLEADRIYTIEVEGTVDILMPGVKIRIPERTKPDNKYNRIKSRILKTLSKPRLNETPSYFEHLEQEPYQSEIQQAMETYQRKIKRKLPIYVLGAKHYLE